MKASRLSVMGDNARAAIGGGAPSGKGRPRILVVEDEPTLSLDLSEQLSDLGYDVVGVATNGEAALRHVVQAVPDLVLMDVQIEGSIDGIETARRIPSELTVPVIYLTAHAD